MANLAQIKDQVLRSVNYQYTDQFHIRDLINDAVTSLVDAGKLKKKATISVIAGTNNYALPTDFKSPGTLQDETSPNAVLPYELVDISENRFGYAIESGYIYLKPVPSQALTLTHYYYNYPALLVADTDIPTEIDAQYHNVLGLYAIAMIIPILKKDTSTRYAVAAANLADTRAWQMWQDGLKSFADANTRKNKNNRVRDKVVW
jgi:hypothetical protein